MTQRCYGSGGTASSLHSYFFLLSLIFPLKLQKSWGFLTVAVFLNWGAILLLRTWQCLKTFWVVTSPGVYFARHLVDREASNAAKYPTMHGTAPIENYYSAPNVSRNAVLLKHLPGQLRSLSCLARASLANLFVWSVSTWFPKPITYFLICIANSFSRQGQTNCLKGSHVPKQWNQN